MNRLTNKYGNGEGWVVEDCLDMVAGILGETANPTNVIGELQPLLHIEEKLAKLEDLEEELGIELLTIRDAFVNGFYIIDHKGKIVFVRPNDAYPDFECHAIYSYVYNQEDMIYYFFKDYGRTWALTKEELENESTKL